MATGLVAALLLVFAPFIPPEESAITGAVLCGFALGWAMLAVLSVRFTDQPQRWAAAPALVMGLGGLLLLVFGSSVQGLLNWLWPPLMLALAIWMLVRAHRLRSRSGRWPLTLVIGLLALASIGGGFETVREAADAKGPVPGRLIDVGGHRLYLSCTGSGSPTVVLEPGGGAMSSDLGLITPAVARDTRVCVYDRAGRGWSETADTTQDGTQIATDLHTLLQRGNVPGPYVLAGHSFGGLYVLTYAARYPDEVAGMVLVDSTAPASAAKQVAEPPDQGSYDVVGRVSALLSTPGRLGLGRNLHSAVDEYVRASASVQEAASLRDFDDKPLFVLTAGSGNDAAWFTAQNHLATLSTNSAHRVVDGATHQALIAEKGPAATTTRAILDVVAAVRSGRPLG
jgi:pimeloyl-ACP methyl ester carboxylesterase